MKLSEKIYRIRKARGYSQEQFGSMLGNTNTGGISRQSVSSWENGENEPTLDNLRDIAKVLNVSFNALLDEKIDLSDDRTMIAILNGERVIYDNNAWSNFTYWIRPYGVKPRHYIFIGVYAVLAALCVVFGFLAFEDNMINDLWFFFFMFSIAATAPLTIFLVTTIRAIVSGRPGASCAKLTPEGITIYTAGQADNTLFIPTEKIERIELTGKRYRIHGALSIVIKDRQNPVTMHNIFKPQEVIDIFGKLDSYIEDSDGIKIL